MMMLYNTTGMAHVNKYQKMALPHADMTVRSLVVALCLWQFIVVNERIIVF